MKISTQKLSVEEPGLGRLDLPFREAENFFSKKISMTRADFDALRGEAQVYAFTVARISSVQLIDDIRQEIAKAIAEGTTLADFRAAFPALMGKHGWTGTTPWHVETIFRTNVQMSYGLGQLEGLQRVTSAFPFWQYAAINDSRVRPSHFALNGKVYPANHPFWRIHYPPWGYNCRCDVIPLVANDVEGGVESDDGPPQESGFNGPGLVAEQLKKATPQQIAETILPRGLSAQAQSDLWSKLADESKLKLPGEGATLKETAKKIKVIGAPQYPIVVKATTAAEIEAAKDAALVAKLKEKFPHAMKEVDVDATVAAYKSGKIGDAELTALDKVMKMGVQEAVEAAAAAAAEKAALAEALDKADKAGSESLEDAKKRAHKDHRNALAKARRAKKAGKTIEPDLEEPSSISDSSDPLQRLSRLELEKAGVVGVDVPRDATSIEGHNLNVRIVEDANGSRFYEFYGKWTSDELALFARQSSDFKAAGERTFPGSVQGGILKEYSSKHAKDYRPLDTIQFGGLTDRKRFLVEGKQISEFVVNTQKIEEVWQASNRHGLKNGVLVSSFKVRIPATGNDVVDYSRLKAVIGKGPGERILDGVTPQERKRVGIIRAIVHHRPMIAAPQGDSSLSIPGRPELRAVQSKHLWQMNEAQLREFVDRERIDIDIDSIKVKNMPTLGYSTQTMNRGIDYKDIRVFHGSSMGPEGVADVISSGRLSSSYQRIRDGNGVLNEADKDTGGADSVFMRILSKKKTVGLNWTDHYAGGKVQFIFDAKTLDRLDAYAFNGDKFGRAFGEAPARDRRTIKQLVHENQRRHERNNEVMFRRGLEFDGLVKIHVANPIERQQLIKRLRERGITRINGKAIEDFIVSYDKPNSWGGSSGFSGEIDARIWD